MRVALCTPTGKALWAAHSRLARHGSIRMKMDCGARRGSTPPQAEFAPEFRNISTPGNARCPAGVGIISAALAGARLWRRNMRRLILTSASVMALAIGGGGVSFAADGHSTPN